MCVRNKCAVEDCSRRPDQPDINAQLLSCILFHLKLNKKSRLIGMEALTPRLMCVKQVKC